MEVGLAFKNGLSLKLNGCFELHLFPKLPISIIHMYYFSYLHSKNSCKIKVNVYA